MKHRRRPIWLYSFFQYPLIFLSTFLLLSALLWLLGLGRPNVAVAVALDLSSSTYGEPEQFNTPGTIMSQEIEAVKAYIDESDKLRKPNQVQIFGFRSKTVVPLTPTFAADGNTLKAELDRGMVEKALPLSQREEPRLDNLNDPILKGIQALSNINQSCRELLLVSDSGVELEPGILLNQAVQNRVKINAIVFQNTVPELELLVARTKGLYITGQPSDFNKLFSDRFFSRFNSNLKWIIICLGLAWISLMWLIALPLDRWILQDLLQMHWSLSGRIVTGHALFWSALTPLIVWQLLKISGFHSFLNC